MIVVHGMSDLHLQVIEARMKRRYGVEINPSLPRIAYRETITTKARAEYLHKKQSGGHGQYARVAIRVEPLHRGDGFEFPIELAMAAHPRDPELVLTVARDFSERHGARERLRGLNDELTHANRTLEQFVTLRAGTDIQVCNSCGRVLFLDE